MAITNSVTMTLSYTDDDSSQLKLDKITSAALSSVESKVIALNASLAASTDGGLSGYFVSKAGQPLKKITKATLLSEEETPIVIPD